MVRRNFEPQRRKGAESFSLVFFIGALVVKKFRGKGSFLPLKHKGTLPTGLPTVRQAGKKNSLKGEEGETEIASFRV